MRRLRNDDDDDGRASVRQGARPDGRRRRARARARACYAGTYYACPTVAACFGGVDPQACFAACVGPQDPCFQACLDHLEKPSPPVGCQIGTAPPGLTCN